MSVLFMKQWISDIEISVLSQNMHYLQTYFNAVSLHLGIII